MENHINTIGELSSYESDVLKFQSLNGLTLPVFNKNKFEFKNEGDKLCVVYCVWANKGYVKFLYLSLLTQLMNTDVIKYDIRIFVSEDLYDFVLNLLSPILDSSKLIKTPNGMSFKYGISVHPELKKYQVINFTDTDAFVFSKDKNVYTKIYQFHKKNPDKILMCNDIGGAMETFSSRHKTLTKFNNLSFDEYITHFKDWFKNGVSKIEDYLDTKKWYLSCHFSYNQKIYDNFKYTSYICNSLYKQFGCDETVWIMYIIANSYKILRISKATSYNWVGAEEFNDFIENPNFNQDLFIHPATGDYCKNEKLKILYNEIFLNLDKYDQRKVI